MKTETPPSQKLLFARTLEELERRGIAVDQIRMAHEDTLGPRDPDELWTAVHELTGYKIPRVAVCEGHTAPFDIFSRVYFEELSDVLMIGNRGGGKRLALDTPIPSPGGWIAMGEIQEGDHIFDQEGRICKVVKVHPIEAHTNAYRVVFSDGVSVVADAEHLWETWSWRLQSVNGKKKQIREANIVTTAQIRNTLYRKYGSDNEFNHSIPVAKALNLPPVDLPIDPWLFGVWLGDGCTDRRREIHTNSDEVAFFAGQLRSLGAEITVKRGKSGAARRMCFSGIPFRGCLPKDGKRILDPYLRASIIQRRSLLQGWMDTDGHITKDGKAELTVSSTILRDGAMELLRTLGYKPSFTEKTVRPCSSSNVAKHGIKDEYGPYYRIRFQPYMDEPPVRMPHKVERLKYRPDRPQMSSRRQIVQVESINPVPMRCITVDSPSNLYLCGEGMIPTHNTTLSGFLHGAKGKWKPGYKTAIAGAVERQSDRAYAEFKRFTQFLVDEIVDSLKKKTTWANGSETEVLAGTVKAVNGPHPHFAQFDELELTTAEVFEEWQNMSQGDQQYAGQNLLSSTRKRMYGLVQSIVKECEEAKRNGDEPPWTILTFCFTPETRVRAERGLIPISEIVVGEKVLSRDGIFREVKRVTNRPYKGEIRRFRTSVGLSIGLTPDHLISGVWDDKNGTPAVKQPSNQRKLGYSERWIPTEKLLVSDGTDNRHPQASYVRTEILANPIDMDVDAETLWAMGLWIAEGHVHNGGIAFTLHEDEVAYEQRIRNLMEPKGYTVSRYKTGQPESKAVQIVVFNTELREWGEIFGKGASNKSIPGQFLNLPPEKLRFLMDGILDGDGCERWNTLNQTSSLLATQIVDIALRLGEQPTLTIPKWKHAPDSYKASQVYTVRNADYRQTTAHVEGERQQTRRRGYWHVLDHQYAKVVQNDVEEYDGQVYDLTIEGDPSFVVENILVHNCVFETMAPVPDCGKRDKSGELLCGCDKVVKGKWPDGTVRTFESVCNGRAARADGFMNLEDVHRRFAGLGRKTWEAQQECLRPSTEGLVHAWWDPSLYELPVWYPRPEYGPIYRSWDWGGTNPHAVLWHQMLKVPVRFKTVEGEVFELDEGAIVTFDEVYHSGGGFYNLGLEVFERTEEWRQCGYEFEVEFDFCDPAGASPKEDVKTAARDHDWPVPQWRMIPDSIERTVEKHIEWGEDGRLYVVGPMCPNLVDEYEAYHWPEIKVGMPPPKRPVLVDDHAVDSKRYAIWNLYRITSHKADGEAPIADADMEHDMRNRSRELARKPTDSVYGVAPDNLLAPGYPEQATIQNKPVIRRQNGGRSIRRG